MTGLFPKYTIINNETGQQVEGFAFVLRPETDLHARAALQTYIASVHEENSRLAADLSYVLQRICTPAAASPALNDKQRAALEKLQRGGTWELRNLGGVTFAQMMALVKAGAAIYKGFNGTGEYFAAAVGAEDG